MSLPRTSRILTGLACRLSGNLEGTGYTRNGKTPRFVAGNRLCCLVVDIQRSTQGGAQEMRVTVNAGLWMNAVASRLGGPRSPEGLSAMDCHWWLRCGQLDAGKQERWWNIRGEEELDSLAPEVWESLSPMVALFAPLTTESACLSYFGREESIPFLDPIHKWGIVLSLAAELDDSGVRRKAILELESIGRSRPLPIGHKMLLRSLQTGRT